MQIKILHEFHQSHSQGRNIWLMCVTQAIAFFFGLTLLRYEFSALYDPCCLLRS